ncbi:hypothetical protein AB6E21_05785 [Photobacterium swingsii]|uniref:hypothetical protein n=1 Tax=Photobacterium swingsii TaxID=680026 RepID=UPI003553F2CC
MSLMCVNWTALQWKNEILEHFFIKSSKENNTPVTFLPINDSSLAQILGEDPDNIEHVYDAFRCHLPQSREEFEIIIKIHDRFSLNDEPTTANINLINTEPSHFLILIFSCLVACTAPNSSGSQYRQRMQDKLGYDRPITNLKGLSIMWKATAAWLEKEKYYRDLLLPDIGREKQIGYAKKLAFPEMADRNKIIDSFVNITPENFNSHMLNQWLSNHLTRNFSHTFSEAARQYIDVSLHGGSRKDLEESLFYQGVLSVLEQETFKQDITYKIPSIISIELFFSVYDQPYMELQVDGDLNKIKIDQHGLVNKQWFFNENYLQKKGLIQDKLFTSLSGGLLVFVNKSDVIWEWSKHVLENQDFFVFATKKHDFNLRCYKLIKRDLFGEWSLYQVNSNQNEAFHEYYNFVTNSRDDTFLLSFRESVRVGLGYLNNSISSPIVVFEQARNIQYRLNDQVWNSLVQKNEDEWEGVPYYYEGLFLIRVETSSGNYRYRKIQTHKYAIEHQRIIEPQETCFHWHLDPSFTELPQISYCFDGLNELNEEDSRLFELLEVLYALGRSGLNEKDVIFWIKKAFEGKVNYWHVLRSLCECGWLEPVYYKKWPVCKYFLRPLRVLTQNINDGTVRAHFDGSISHLLHVKIKNIVRNEGMLVQQGLSLSRFAVRSFYVDGTKLQIDNMVASLECPIEPLLWASSPHEKPVPTVKKMQEIQVWCWKKGLFLSPEKVKQSSCNKVKIARLRHLAKNGMDHYQVSNGGVNRHYLTSDDAIFSGYLAADMPLFRKKKQSLECMTLSGALPLAYARSYRFLSLISSGPSGYSDPCSGYLYALLLDNGSVVPRNIHPLIENKADHEQSPKWMKAYSAQQIALGGNAIYHNKIIISQTCHVLTKVLNNA